MVEVKASHFSYFIWEINSFTHSTYEMRLVPCVMVEIIALQ